MCAQQQEAVVGLDEWARRYIALGSGLENPAVGMEPPNFQPMIAGKAFRTHGKRPDSGV